MIAEVGAYPAHPQPPIGRVVEGAGRGPGLRARLGVLLALLFGGMLAFMRLIDVTEDGKAVILFGFLFSVTALYVALLSPRWFPLLLVAYLPYCMVFAITIPGLTGFNMMNLLVAAGVVAWASCQLQGRMRNPVGLFEGLVALYALLGFLSAIQSYTLAPGFVEVALLFRGWVTPILLFFICRGLVRDREDIRNALTVMACTTVMVALVTWVEGIQRSDRGSIEHSRVAGPLRQPNEMGAFLVYYGVLLLALAVMAKPWRTRAAYFAGFLVVARAMLYTFSRGAYVSLAAGSVVVLFLRSPLYLAGAAAGGALTMAACPRLIPHSVAVRLGQTTSEEADMFGAGVTEAEFDRSSRLRFVLWRAAGKIIRQYPITGVGLGRFPLVVEQYTEIRLKKDDPHDAHNAFLLIAGEMGLPALALFVLILLILMITALRLYFGRGSPLLDRTLALAFLGSEMGVFVSCMLGSRFSDEALVGNFWILVALVIVLQRLRRQERALEPAWR
jgi:putative inorganic carbon (HCO3(-)) transporter